MNTLKRTAGTSLKKVFCATLVTLFLFLLFSVNSNAQDNKGQEEILMVADVMPSFPGGPKALMETIQKYINYSGDESEKGISGRVVLKFAVDKEGKAIMPSIVKGLSPGIDQAVLNVVKRLPKFEPAKQNGQPVSVWYAIPVPFQVK